MTLVSRHDAAVSPTASEGGGDESLLDEVGLLLADLSSVQTELLDVLQQKRQSMAAGDLAQLESLQPEEERIAEKLKACYARRSELLKQGQADGVQADTLTDLVDRVAADEGEKVGKLKDHLQDSRQRIRDLRLEHLTNWVVAQKSLLHVSRMLEIVATGGKIQPTYGGGEHCARGSLCDHEA